MENKVEKIFNSPKGISVEHIDLPILEQEKNIEKISSMLDMPIANTHLNSKRIEEIKATYYYNPKCGGKSIIVGDDGSYLLTTLSATNFEELLEKYKDGERNGNFINSAAMLKPENNDKMIKIEDENLKKVVQEIVGNSDPYWNDPVYKTVKKIIELPYGTENSIIRLLDTSNFTSKQLFDIYKCIIKVCKKIGITIDFSTENAEVVEKPYNLTFKKVL